VIDTYVREVPEVGRVYSKVVYRCDDCPHFKVLREFGDSGDWGACFFPGEEKRIIQAMPWDWEEPTSGYRGVSIPAWCPLPLQGGTTGGDGAHLPGDLSTGAPE